MGSPAPARVKKSDRTRAAILEAARQAFQVSGYEHASVRAIATAANIDPAMVIRYFGTKERLFLAAVVVDLELPDLTTLPRSRRGRALVGHFLNSWEVESRGDVLITLLRSAATNELAAARLQEVFSQQVLRTVAAVVPDEEVHRRASLIAAHMLGLALTRYILLLPSVAGQSPNAVLEDWGAAVQRHLHGPLPPVGD